MTEDKRFHVSGEVVTRLGSELVSSATQAVLELVKNAYDAEAKNVSIEIRPSVECWLLPDASLMYEKPADPAPDGEAAGEQADLRQRELSTAAGKTRSAPGSVVTVGPADAVAEQPGSTDDRGEPETAPVFPKRLEGQIQIIDDGHGMTEQDIEGGWLTISYSSKRAASPLAVKKPTGTLHRYPLGDKGLGRLGAQRLGDHILIRTRPPSLPGRIPSKDEEVTVSVEYQVGFSFDAFSHALVEQVSVYYRAWPVSECSGWPAASAHGTVVQISGLHEPADWSNAKTLGRALGTLRNPFAPPGSFDVSAAIDDVSVAIDAIDDDVRASALNRWNVTYDGQRTTVVGVLRREGFLYPRDPAQRQALLADIAGDHGRGLAGVIEAALARANIKVTSPVGTWPIEVRQVIDPLVGLPNEDQEVLADHPPGGFSLLLDSLPLRVDRAREAGMTAFTSREEYRQWIEQHGGIAIYRDGFRVAGGEDILNLGEGFSVDASFYGLRPRNAIGAISITGQHNPGLEETTDREGFRRTTTYAAFQLVLQSAVSAMNSALETAGRTSATYANSLQVPVKYRDQETQALIDAAQKTVADTGHLRTAVSKAARVLVQAASTSSPENQRLLSAAVADLADAGSVLDDLDALPALSDAIGARFGELNDQLDEFYGLIGVGLVAESLSHEFDHAVGRLVDTCDRLEPLVDGDPRAAREIRQLRDIARSLRAQLGHLAPQLSGARTRKADIDLGQFVAEHVEFHQPDLRRRRIDVDLQISNPATVRVARGRLAQALDNLIYNSAYWARQGIRSTPAVITIRVEGPVISFSDTGPGVGDERRLDLFEPFTTSRKSGRGLGLFISRQLLERDDVSLTLAPSTTQSSQRSTFIIDATKAATKP